MKAKRFNKGTKKGKSLITNSLKRLGCGRSVLVDKNGEILCGHDVYESALELEKKIVYIETYGDVLIAVKRMDVDVNSTKGMELSLVDNLCSEKNLNWDADAIIESMEENISFDPRTWGAYECLVKELDLEQLLREDVSVKEKKIKKEVNTEISNQLSLF